ncbi:ABC-three component system middle component 6 [Nocardia jinanensis]|uniref:Uncharacterized protein n=1 Tax=Nocardia jinanensis TaxID=382504 RepID=A0A917VX92_9NOCA|nr:ABC-three component system middle component 6 [Nocardia jinanensis]GGL27138.1 hypothetical protein GCM10011588_47360 [Nocardia jinanensis]
MITPTKGISPQRALLSIGAQVVQAVEAPVTVSQAWSRLLEWRTAHEHRDSIPFWWFALSLDVLYALGLATLDDDLLVIRRGNAAAITGR